MKASQHFTIESIGLTTTIIGRTPEGCLRQLMQLHPHFIRETDQIRRAQECSKQARTVIGGRGGYWCAGPGDIQAIDIYEIAVAIGFYRLECQLGHAPLLPVFGSNWTREQLLRMQRLGIGHGLWIRNADWGLDEVGEGHNFYASV
jgi:hypothetical protein